MSCAIRSISHLLSAGLFKLRAKADRRAERSNISSGIMARLVRCDGARDKHFVFEILSPIRAAINFALPPRCAGCGVIVEGDHQLCTPCWESLDFLTGAGCSLCGSPAVAAGLVCGPCLNEAPAHDGVRFAVVYGDLARQIVLRLKHGGRTGLAKLAATAMERHLPKMPSLLVPVPLHRWRIWQRGFNQSSLIAAHLAANSGHRVADDILIRAKGTPLLRGLGAKDRRKAVQGAFTLQTNAKERLLGQHVILVDDVYTSGATANACARMLKRGGAQTVTVLCWARVLIND